MYRFAEPLECSVLCEDTCEQLPDQRDDCKEKLDPETRYHYDPASKTCKEFRYVGCPFIKNAFLTVTECARVCGAEVYVVVNGTNVLANGDNLQVVDDLAKDDSSRVARAAETGPTVTQADGTVLDGVTAVQINPDQVDEEERKDFCDSVNEQLPELREMAFEADEGETGRDVEDAVGRINGDLTAEMEEVEAREKLEYPDMAVGTSRSKRQLNIFGLHLRKLRWATVYRQTKCKTFKIKIRIFCIRALFHRPPSHHEFRRLCGLVKAGIKKHWERDITYMGSTWKVVIDVRESLLLSKKIIIKYYTSKPNNGASHNTDILPIVVKYKTYVSQPDARFSYVAAHELGHSVLMNTGGLIYSWTHKGKDYPSQSNNHSLTDSKKSLSRRTVFTPSSFLLALTKYE